MVKKTGHQLGGCASQIALGRGDKRGVQWSLNWLDVVLCFSPKGKEGSDNSPRIHAWSRERTEPLWQRENSRESALWMRKKGLQEKTSSLYLKNGCISGCDRIGSWKYGTGVKERGLGLKVIIGMLFVHSFIHSLTIWHLIWSNYEPKIYWERYWRSKNKSSDPAPEELTVSLVLLPTDDLAYLQTRFPRVWVKLIKGREFAVCSGPIHLTRGRRKRKH